LAGLPLGHSPSQ